MRAPGEVADLIGTWYALLALAKITAKTKTKQNVLKFQSKRQKIKIEERENLSRHDGAKQTVSITKQAANFDELVIN